MEKHADNWRKHGAQASARMKRQVNEKLAATAESPKDDSTKQTSKQLNEEEKLAIMHAKRRYRRVTKYIKTGNHKHDSKKVRP